MSKKHFFFGSGALYGTLNVAGNPTPMKFANVKGVDIEFSGSIKELHGDSKFPDALGQGKSKITGKAKFSRIDLDLIAQLYGGTAAAAGSLVPVENEAGSIPATPGPYTITVANGATFSEDLGVRFAADGQGLTKVSADPETGEYAVNATTGVYTFAAADQGKAVLIDYLYTAETGTTVDLNNERMGQGTSFKGIFSGEHDGKKTVLILYKCLSEKFKMGSKEEDFLEMDFDFQAQSNDAGQVCSLSVSG